MTDAPPPLAVALPDGVTLTVALADLKAGLAASPIATLLTDPDLDPPGPRITFANPALERQTGYAAGELVGRTPRLFQGPLTDRAVLDRMKRELRAGRPFVGTAVNYRKDGATYPLSWSILPVTHHGRVVRYLSHQTAGDPSADPTKSALRARADLSESRFDLAVTGCGLGFWDCDFAAGTVYLSPGWKAQLGFSDAGLANDPTTFPTLLHPDDKGRVQAAVERFVAGRDAEYRQEFRLRHRSGRWVWVASRGAAVRDPAGRAVRLVGTHTDISDRKAAEEAVRVSEQRLQALLAHSDDTVVVTDADGYISFVSGSGERMTGRPVAALMGRPVAEHVHPDDLPAVAGWIKRVAADPGRVERHAFRYRHADGDYLHLDVTGQNLLDHPAVGGLLGNVRDVTAERRLEEQVRQGQKLEALGLLAGGVAHDFNNLLTVILGSLEQLAPPAAPADRALLDQVRATAGRARGLADSLLGFARQGRPAAARAVAVGPLLAATADTLGRVLDKRISVETRLPADLPAAVCDPGAVELAVLNLAVNARDAMPGGGVLTIAAGELVVPPARTLPHPDARPGRYVRIGVADTGCGMSDAVQARVFEPFFTTKPAGEGTGLGLPMVADTARRLGGWVSVLSEEGVGTQVELVLPAADAPAAEPAPAPAPAAGRRVLVVDDEELVRKVAAAVLGRAGHEVAEATDGAEAVAAYRRHRPDLVLLDLNLPGRSGEAVLTDLLAADPAARVLVVSGNLADAPPPGAAGGLAKPFTSDRLLAAVRAALGE